MNDGTDSSCLDHGRKALSSEPSSPGRSRTALAPAGPRRVPPPAPPRGRELARTVVAPLLLVTAAVVYNDWLLEFLLPTGLDPRHSYVSELFAADQRFHVLFTTAELVAATLVVAGALLARDPRAGAPAEGGWWCLVAFGVCSVADVIVPMRCAPSVEPGCEAVNPWHTATSGLVHAALFGSMFLLTVAAARTRWPVPHRWAPWVPAAALATAVATVGPLFGHPGWHGVPQRAHLALVGAWFVLLAAGLRGSARASGP
ncbi:DUF998 domain-containing protein [Streptomyces sp. I05A-00742]|uniref:DUF998 domain-containing protein n=1 Tax=Streptomyces sp. I05A-00742 TaxID=2732853 RepID=UPI001BB2A687|nr:DUF998 domain-containing protein [Streptomyces sp. I05A-00742]